MPDHRQHAEKRDHGLQGLLLRGDPVGRPAGPNSRLENVGAESIRPHRGRQADAKLTDRAPHASTTNQDRGARRRRPARAAARALDRLRQPRRLRAALARPGDPQPLPGGRRSPTTAPTAARSCVAPQLRAPRLDGARPRPRSTACAATPTARAVVEEIKSVRRDGALSPAVARDLRAPGAALRLDARRKRERGPVARRAGADRDRRRRRRARSRSRPTSRRSRRRSASASTAAARARGRARAPAPTAARAGERARASPTPSSAPARSEILAAVETALASGDAPPARGADRHRQDGRRALPGAALRARARQAPLRAHRQDPAAGDGDARCCSCSNQARRFRALRLRAKAQDVRQRRGDLPRGVLPLRHGLLRQARDLRRRAAPARRAVDARARRRLRGRRAGARSARSRSASTSPDARAGRGLRLQLRLRPLRRALRLRPEGRPLRHHPGDRRDPQPGRPRPRLLQPELSAASRAARRRGGGARRRRRSTGGSRRSARALAAPDRGATVEAAARRAAGAATARSRRALPEDELLAPAPRLRRRLRRLPRAPARDAELPRRRPVRRPLLRPPPLPRTAWWSRTPPSAALAERRGGDRRCSILCKDPSRFLARGDRPHARDDRPLGDALAARVLPRPPGLRARAHGRRSRSPNPFPPEHRRVVVDATVATTFQRAAGQLPRLAERLAAFADAVPGNCLVLFPSYALPGRGRRRACAPRDEARAGPAAHRHRARARGAPRSAARRGPRRRPAARGRRRRLRRRASTTPATSCARWRSSAPACRC